MRAMQNQQRNLNVACSSSTSKVYLLGTKIRSNLICAAEAILVIHHQLSWRVSSGLVVSEAAPPSSAAVPHIRSDYCLPAVV